jgi:hypothetical protein
MKYIKRALQRLHDMFFDRDMSFMLCGSAIAQLVYGHYFGAIFTFTMCLLSLLPKFETIYKDWMMSEADRIKIETTAHSTALELNGKVNLLFKDADGNVLLRNYLDSTLVLNCLVVAVEDGLVRLSEEYGKTDAGIS